MHTRLVHKAEQALLSQHIGAGIYFKPSVVHLVELSHLFILKGSRRCATHWTEVRHPCLAHPLPGGGMQLILQPLGTVRCQTSQHISRASQTQAH